MKTDLTNYLKSAPYLLISSIANIEYLTGYSGFSQTERECFLLIGREKKYLITDGRYSEALRKTAKDFEVIDTGAGRFISQKSEIMKGVQKIAVEEYDLSVTEYRNLEKIVRKIVGVDLSQIRSIKSDQEADKIKKACLLSDKAFEFILKILKTGITEKEVSDELELFYKKNKAQISFSPIVAYGPNSSVPHHASGETKLRPNSIVLLDFGAKVDGYSSDMTRTVFFGKAPAEFKKMHAAVKEAQKRAISQIKIGAKAKDLDNAARKYLLDLGYPNIPHSVGHGIGLLVHEPPHISTNSKDKLKAGMIFSVEPGVYIEGMGGVRIEDLILLTPAGPQLISKSRRNIIEV